MAAPAVTSATLLAADSSLRITYTCPGSHGVPAFSFEADQPFLVIGHDSEVGHDYTDLKIRFDGDRPLIIRGVMAAAAPTRSAAAPSAVSGFPGSTEIMEPLIFAEVMSVEWRSGGAFQTSRFAMPPDTKAVINQVRQACGRSAL